MSYFYVDSTVGTRTTGGGLTKQTGSFSALGAGSVYATIVAAITDGATSGDYVCISTNHAETGTSSVTFATPTSGDYLYFVSCDSANCDAYQKATVAQLSLTGSTSHLQYSSAAPGRSAWFGVYLKTEGRLIYNPNTDPDVNLLMNECTLEAVGADSELINNFSDGFVYQATNCTFTLNASTDLIGKYNAVHEFRGCVFTGITNLLTSLTGSSGGYTGRWIGCDLSSVTGYLVEDGGATPANDDAIQVRFIGCKLNASLTGYWNETKENYNQNLLAVNSSSSSAAAEYQYRWEMYGGHVEQDTSFYRNGSSLYWDSSQRISLKCVTTADCTPASPFYFDIPGRTAALSDADHDTLRVYLMTSLTLDNADVWIEALYPDGTNKNEYNFISTRHTDIMDASGTALTTNTLTWTGYTSENRYQIDVDTSSNPGINCAPILRVYVAVAGTIYFDPDVGTV